MPKLVYDFAEGYVIGTETVEVEKKVYDYWRRLCKRLRKLVDAYGKLIVYGEQEYVVDYKKPAVEIRRHRAQEEYNAESISWEKFTQ